MRMRNALGLAAVVGVAAGLAGCPSDDCALETPKVDAIATSCTQVANQPVSYPVQLCPTCNQFGATCEVTISGDEIFLDTKVEACDDTTSCPGGTACDINETNCTFNAPATPGIYPVIAVDGGSGAVLNGELVVIAPGSGSPSCALTSASR